MSHAITADFRTAPYSHQLREFEAHCESPGRALLWVPRTGKTKSVIDTACHLHKEGHIDAVVVLAPNGVHENWIRRELPKHGWPTTEYKALAWRTSVAGEMGVKRAPAAEREAWQETHDGWWRMMDHMLSLPVLTWFAFNSESVIRDDVRRVLARVMRRRRVLAVFDESDDFRKPGSKRTKMMRALANKAAYRRILTGTAVHNSPLAAWSQYELLQPGALGFARYRDFKRRHAVYETCTTRAGRSYTKLVEYTNMDELRDRMAEWSSVVLREDCDDLPDVVGRVRSIAPSDEQLRLYRELHSEFLLTVGGKRVSIGEDTTRLNKLQQVMSGFLIDEYGDVHDVPGINPRLEALSDEVYLSPCKVIVWCQFREDIRRVASRLRADGHEIVEYHGGIGDDDKQAALDGFQNDAAVKALVGQPGAGGRGLDMSAAGEIYNYSHTFDAIYREQSKERATAVGGENIGLVDFMAPGVDHYVRENVDGKISVADAVAGHGLREALERCRI